MSEEEDRAKRIHGLAHEILKVVVLHTKDPLEQLSAIILASRALRIMVAHAYGHGQLQALDKSVLEHVNRFLFNPTSGVKETIFNTNTSAARGPVGPSVDTTNVVPIKKGRDSG